MTCGAVSMVAQEAARRPTVKDTRGGSTETDAREVAQNPTGMSTPAVMTATPLAWWRITALNRAGPGPEGVSSSRWPGPPGVVLSAPPLHDRAAEVTAVMPHSALPLPGRSGSLQLAES